MSPGVRASLPYVKNNKRARSTARGDRQKSGFFYPEGTREGAASRSDGLNWMAGLLGPARSPGVWTGADKLTGSNSAAHGLLARLAPVPLAEPGNLLAARRFGGVGVEVHLRAENVLQHLMSLAPHFHVAPLQGVEQG